MCKMVLHDPFGHFKHKLCSKERSGVKLTVWLPTTKSWESTQFPRMQVEWDIPLESSWWGLQLYLYFIAIEGRHAKLWAPKIAGILTMKIPRLPLESPLYPRSATSQGTCPDSLLFRFFHFKLTLESNKKLGNTSMDMFNLITFLNSCQKWNWGVKMCLPIAYWCFPIWNQDLHHRRFTIKKKQNS
jgi:hypothetical protein